MTLFDMKNKKNASGTPKKTSGSNKSPLTSPKKSPYKQPPIVIRWEETTFLLLIIGRNSSFSFNISYNSQGFISLPALQKLLF